MLPNEEQKTQNSKKQCYCELPRFIVAYIYSLFLWHLKPS